MNYLTNPSQLQNMLQMANQLAKSELIPKALQKKPADLLVVLGMAAELNIPPMQGLNAIHVIQGKPTISPQLMLAMIYTKQINTIIDIEDDYENMKVTVRMARDDSHKTDYTCTWDMERAKQMGLVGKSNWKAQPVTMLRWRAVSEAARVVFPDVICGLYTPEELEKPSEDEKLVVYDADGNIQNWVNNDLKKIEEKKNITQEPQSPPQIKEQREIQYNDLAKYVQGKTNNLTETEKVKKLGARINDILSGCDEYTQIKSFNEINQLDSKLCEVVLAELKKLEE